MNNRMIISLTAMLPLLATGLQACSDSPIERREPVAVTPPDEPTVPVVPDIPDDPAVLTSDNVVAWDFDSRDIEDGVTFRPANCQFDVAANPSGSGKTGHITHNKCGRADCVVFTLDRPLDFTRNSGKITVDVYAPTAGTTCQIKLTSSSSGAPAITPSPFVKVTNTKANEWETLEFDLSGYKIESNWYNKITIYFNFSEKNEEVKKKMGEEWFFDNITIPDADLGPICLFKRLDRSGIPMPVASIPWIKNSTANPEVLSPSESVDGNWWLYIRGGDGTHGRLGVYTQSATTFNPLGQWDYYAGNPIVDLKFNGDHDDFTAIDPSPVKGPDGTMYLFYKGTSKKLKKPEDSKYFPSILLATSKDGFNYQKVEKPWLEDAGVADVVYNEKNQKYYLFVSRRVYEFSDPLAGGTAAKEYEDIIDKGGGPANFDRYSINGEKIFRIDGIDKWFMIYQGSPCHDDFPARFHCAYSDDLINWTKVKNDKPLFARGDKGEWDQGAIWAPSVFEYNGHLYMYYEGWGAIGNVPNRDKKYFSQGHSEIGVAVCKTSDFINWCNMSN